MVGFLGGLTRAVSLRLAGLALASGGAIGLAHSTPDILRGVGAICEEVEFSDLTSGNKQLTNGRQYVGNVDTKKFYDVTKRIQDGTIDSICSI